MKMAEIKRLTYNNEEQDRLTSLPETILTAILSLLPIKSAAATSILSYRWRHLWTNVTRLNLSTDGSHLVDIIDHILYQLVSPKLSVFELHSSAPFSLPECNVVESCFQRIFSRNVESVYIDVQCSFYQDFFWVPACLFKSQVFVVLELSGMLMLQLSNFKDDAIQLPNLKRLKLDYLVDVPLSLGYLIKSCPLLEELDLRFKFDDVVDAHIEGSVDIYCHNLLSLMIHLESSRQTERAKFVIDTPTLTNLQIRDCYSFYYFVHNPSNIITACVDLRKDDSYFEDEELDDGKDGDDDYLSHVSEFIRGLCFVSNLSLKIDSHSNILAFCSSKDRVLPIFCNLTRFETTLDGIGLNGWRDLLLAMHCFPNLKDLKVNMEGDPSLEHNSWCVPNCVPDCLVRKLKKIHISGLYGSEDDLKLLEYVLSNSNLLEELRLQRYIDEENEIADAMWKNCQFCRSLFELPRRSSACEVLFSDRHVTASSHQVIPSKKDASHVKCAWMINTFF